MVSSGYEKLIEHLIALSVLLKHQLSSFSSVAGAWAVVYLLASIYTELGYQLQAVKCFAHIYS